ncbi:hypothetical protein VISI1226_16603 [Vibrio sinaloensis DSM 21326]|uniref:Uncharacterized protein n=1 Tax=Vibrio sinaloensis DSM 21326 TaxID=945550 RepID=E8M527_PHOS4|nr:hypothetical protein [Vibrio sinaloensis]EGA70878.1 hypothetical protein VISI1226_16603 [Vibrio sinaloensis DSM 21326]
MSLTHHEGAASPLGTPYVTDARRDQAGCDGALYNTSSFGNAIKENASAAAL